MKPLSILLLAVVVLLAGCAPVDLNAPLPAVDTGIDPNSWVKIPAGEFFTGQFNKTESTAAYEIMLTDVTTAQYAQFLNQALAAGFVKIDGEQVKGYYPGDKFHGAKHEERIDPGDWIFIPLADPSQRVKYDGQTFSVQPGYENHPMTMVSWFGAWGYCGFYDQYLPSELQWEKAARGSDIRPFPWGEEMLRENANFYASRDPFEDMRTYGSRTTPVGFYNGKSYAGYLTLDSVSPYGLYDMAGNVWQWTGSIYEGMHFRFLRGGSKDTYEMDLRIWVRNNAPPSYYSPGVGFRCAR
jgi:formylglycine-generating enzyme required for sulfatase activity